MPNKYAYINGDNLQQAEIKQEPYPYAIIKDFIRPEKLEAICRDFPKLTTGGIFNCTEDNTHGDLAKFIDEIQQPRLCSWLSEQFDLQLENLPTMATLRGHSRSKDGRIHTDSKDKLITLMIYLNSTWGTETGKLRILNSKNINDKAAEVAPSAGTCVIIKTTDNSWHGYKRYIGSRRSIMLNYFVSHKAAKRHTSSHYFSAKFKKIKNLLLPA